MTRASASTRVQVVSADWSVCEGWRLGEVGLGESAEGEALVRADLALLLLAPSDRPLQGLGGFIDWRSGGQLSGLLSRELFVGQVGERLLMPSPRELPLERIVLFGRGEPLVESGFDPDEFARDLFECVRKLRAERVVIGWVDEGADPKRWTAVFDALLVLLRATAEPAGVVEQVSQDLSGSLVAARVGDTATQDAESQGAESQEAESPSCPDTRITQRPTSPESAEVAKGDNAPCSTEAPQDTPTTEPQWWFVAPEALCTRLRGRVLGTPRSTDAP